MVARITEEHTGGGIETKMSINENQMRLLSDK
jgi:hypothetical protein